MHCGIASASQHVFDGERCLTAKFPKICIFHNEDLFSRGDSLHKTSLMNDINLKIRAKRPRNGLEDLIFLLCMKKSDNFQLIIITFFFV